VNSLEQPLAAVVPSKRPTDDLNAPPERPRAATERRLARNVAALFGIPVPDSDFPDRVWFSDYNALTNTDLGRGTALSKRPLDHPPIASATLSKFGPEVKAALVLTGANALLRPVDDVMRSVMQVVSVAEDAGRLADLSRILAWAVMQCDMYVTQPALMIATLQARGVQRATTIGWRPRADRRVHGLQPDELDVEFGTSRNGALDAKTARLQTTRTQEARSLRTLDTLMEEVAPVPASFNDGTASASLLVSDIVDRFVAHLFYVTGDAGYARLVRDEGSRTHLDVFIATTSLLAGFTEGVFAQFDQVVPWREKPAPGAPRPAPEKFNAELEAHWRRLLPRVPDRFELEAHPRAVQVEAVRVVRRMYQVLTSLNSQQPKEVKVLCVKRLAALATLSADLLGQDHRETLLSRSEHLETLLRRAARTSDDAWSDVYYDSLEEARAAAVAIAHAFLDSYDSLTIGSRLEAAVSISPSLTLVANAYGDRGDHALRDEIRDIQLRLWDSPLNEVGIPTLETVEDETWRDFDGLAFALHNYLVPATKSWDSDRGRQRSERAIEIGINLILPMRRNEATHRRNDRPLRLTLQVLGAALRRGYAAARDNDERRRFAEQFNEVALNLRETARMQALIDRSEPPLPEDLLPCLATAENGIMQRQPGYPVTATLTLATVDRCLQCARLVLEDENGLDSVQGRRLQRLESDRQQLADDSTDDS
jgi:hypothetical protein